MEYAHIMPEDILKNPEVKVYVEAGNSCLGALGFTEHGRPHAKRCSNYARNILEALDYDKRQHGKPRRPRAQRRHYGVHAFNAHEHAAGRNRYHLLGYRSPR